MNKSEYDKLAESGYLKAQVSGSYTLYSYSQKTVNESFWNEITMTARGLVLDQDGKPIARPFRKFFNLGERPETQPSALPAETPELADKYDGSLIICFYNGRDGRWQCVTRGSWDSEQARWANIWAEKKAQALDREFTHLFELVAPWNRIVLTYDTEDMIFLSAIHTETGKDCSYQDAVRYARDYDLTPLRYERRPISDLDLADTSVRDAEGFVARYSSGFRVKLKYAEYFRLHKLITGLSIKAIWEQMAAGNDQPPENVPDEFLKWFNEQAAGIRSGFNDVEAAALVARHSTPDFATRKEYAAYFQKFKKLRHILFRMLDEREYASLIWKQIKPKSNVLYKVDEL